MEISHRPTQTHTKNILKEVSGVGLQVPALGSKLKIEGLVRFVMQRIYRGAIDRFVLVRVDQDKSLCESVWVCG
jgi:hypothetical protein